MKSSRRSSVLLCTVWLSTGFAGCAELKPIADAIPVITAEAPNWMSPGPYTADATIVRSDGTPLLPEAVVYADLTWDAPPGQVAPKRRYIATRGPDDRFDISVPADDLQPTQFVTLRWGVESADGTLSLAESEPFRRQVDCAPGADLATLQSMQNSVRGLLNGGDGTAPGAIVVTEAQLNALGYVINTHGYAALNGGGVSFVSPAIVSGAVVGVINPATPPLLLFDSVADSDLTDNEPDSPYVLIGWGYGTAINPVENDTKTRPRIGCVPYHFWTVHEAGWHTQFDGGMVLDDPDFSPEERAMAAQEALTRGALTPLHYHPRVWDVHFWAGPPNGLPRTGIDNIVNGDLLPADGVDGPSGMFFYPPMP